MKNTPDSYDVIVIGGGASGMMAAGTAASRGKRVLLIEKNKKLGAKLAITGGSRCNILNAEADERTLISKYGQAGEFLHSPFSQFGMKEAYAFFESQGLPIEVEANKRAFPKSRKAADVVKTLVSYLQQGGVDTLTGVPVTKIEMKEGTVVGVHVGTEVFTAQSYILATGGLSHPETGSTGDGFPWLANLGHTMHKPNPSLVPLRAADAWIKKLSGTSLPDAKITFFVAGVKKFSARGRILCTHFGLSGPTILNASEKVADLLHEGEVSALIDLKPALDLGALDTEMTKLFDANKNKILKNVFREIAPPGAAESLLSLVGDVNPIGKVHSVTRDQRRALGKVLKAAPVSNIGLMGFDRAIVADGGLSLAEVDTRTMRSKKIKNLFVTGDLLDISRPSGGYSLQLCWTSGFVAGMNA